MFGVPILNGLVGEKNPIGIAGNNVVSKIEATSGGSGSITHTISFKGSSSGSKGGAFEPIKVDVKEQELLNGLKVGEQFIKEAKKNIDFGGIIEESGKNDDQGNVITKGKARAAQAYI